MSKFTDASSMYEYVTILFMHKQKSKIRFGWCVFRAHNFPICQTALRWAEEERWGAVRLFSIQCIRFSNIAMGYREIAHFIMYLYMRFKPLRWDMLGGWAPFKLNKYVQRFLVWWHKFSINFCCADTFYCWFCCWCWLCTLPRLSNNISWNGSTVTGNQNWNEPFSLANGATTKKTTTQNYN